MPTRNVFILILAALAHGTAPTSAFAASADGTQRLTDEAKALRKLIAEAKRKPYRQLTSDEIKTALELPINAHTTAAFLGNPGFKTAQPLPPGVALEPGGYFIYVASGKVTFSFLKAQTPAGKEVLFRCDHHLPWWAWIEAPGVCGVAVIDVPPARAAQLREASRLNGVDAELGYDDRATPEGQAYMAKIKPFFELVVRHCSKAEPPNGSTYAWYGRVSMKAKVVKYRVRVHQSRNDTPYVEESPYLDCIAEGMKNSTLPVPPHLPDAILWLGGFPAAFYWRHQKGDDPVEQE
jgi:hypothetical protein